MKILFINTIDLDKNGITTFIMGNSEFLARNHNVYIVAPNIVNENLKKELEEHRITLYQITNRKSNPLRYFVKLIKFIRKEKFDLIHVNGNSSTMVLELLAGKIAGCQTRIAHSHNTTTEHPFINKLLYPFFELCLTNRMACSQEAGKWLFNNKKFIVVNNGVDLNKYVPKHKIREKIRQMYCISNGDILLGNVGYFNYQKNQEFLIKLLPKLKANYKLMLIGDGYNKQKLRQLVHFFKLEGRVIFTGNVDNVSEYLSALDLFVMPSRFEGLPFALVEAQAAGLWCIISSKISKQANLSDNVIYADIASQNLWVKKIETLKIPSYKDRMQMLSVTQTIIRERGYDANKNKIYFEEQLLKILNNKIYDA